MMSKKDYYLYVYEGQGYATCVCVPVTVDSSAKSRVIPYIAAASLECRASEADRKVTPELVEAAVIYQYSDVPASEARHSSVAAAISGMTLDLAI